MLAERFEREETATIASSGTVSDAIDFRDAAQAILVLPAALTGTSISFQIGTGAGGTFAPLYDASGSLITATVAASHAVLLPAALAPAPFFKIVSGSTETSARTLTLFIKS